LWVLERLRNSASLKALAGDARGPDAFQAELASAHVDIEGLINELIVGVSEKAVTDVGEAEEYVQRLTDATEPSGQIQICQSMLFPGAAPNAEKAVKTQERLEAGISLEQILKESRESEERSGVEQEKEKKRRRIEELQRAKAAHEAQKQRKGKKAQTAPAFTDIIVPCAACDKSPDPGSKLYSCTICFMEQYHKARERGTSWCSSECITQHFEIHQRAQHPCAASTRAGSRCLERRKSGLPRDYLCKECVIVHKVRTQYCTKSCASEDFRRHRDEVHLPLRKTDEEVMDDHLGQPSLVDGAPEHTAVGIENYVERYVDALERLRGNPGWSEKMKMIQVGKDK